MSLISLIFFGKILILIKFKKESKKFWYGITRLSLDRTRKSGLNYISEADSYLLIRNFKAGKLVVALYVDVGLVASSIENLVEEFLE